MSPWRALPDKEMPSNTSVLDLLATISNEREQRKGLGASFGPVLFFIFGICSMIASVWLLGALSRSGFYGYGICILLLLLLAGVAQLTGNTDYW